MREWFDAGLFVECYAAVCAALFVGAWVANVAMKVMSETSARARRMCGEGAKDEPDGLQAHERDR